MMKKLSSIIKLGLVSAVVAVGFSGCGVKIPVNKEVGQLNLKYQIQNQKTRVNKKIAIVAPKFSDIKTNATREMRNPFTGRIIEVANKNINFNELLKTNYRDRLSKALSIDFEDLILKKGFTIGGKYKTFDDMTYPDRKSTYMALIPILDINIDKKNITKKKSRLYSTEEGEIEISGEFIIKMIEPLSKQMFITKRVNLSDLNIKKPYIYEVQTVESNANGIGLTSIISGTMDKASAPNSLRDNTDKVLTEALNEFYQQAMLKIEKYISQEEILALEKDVNGAKGKTGGTW
jgi:neuraminyllactose-binding hemagglutinin